MVKYDKEYLEVLDTYNPPIQFSKEERVKEFQLKTLYERWQKENRGFLGFFTGKSKFKAILKELGIANGNFNLDRFVAHQNYESLFPAQAKKFPAKDSPNSDQFNGFITNIYMRREAKYNEFIDSLERLRNEMK